jgi:hypothetical protein
MGLSRRAYALRRDCNESALRKAIATGRIVTEADGTIDAARADAMWDARTDPAQQRGAHARATAVCISHDRVGAPQRSRRISATRARLHSATRCSRSINASALVSVRRWNTDFP